MNTKNLLLELVLILIVFSPEFLSERYISVNSQDQLTWEVYIGTNNIIRWNNFNVSWYLNSNGAGDGISLSACSTAVQAAFNSWKNISTSSITFSYVDQTSRTWEDDGYNVLYWAEEDDPAYGYPYYLLYPGVLARTIISMENGEIVDVDILFNGDQYNWKTNGTDYDVQAVATHEIGHMIGLAHTEVTSDPKPTMYRLYQANAGWRSLEFDDRVGASFLYGGNLIDNEIFSDHSHFYWDLTVASGKTLSISLDPVDLIEFYNGAKITVNGTLNATNADLISSNLYGETWGGIRFNSGSSGNIQNCFIEDTQYGISVYGASSFSITGTEVTLGNSGVYINGMSSQALIENCVLRSNGFYGVSIASSKVKIKNCQIYNNNLAGISCAYGSDIDLIGNNIYSNGTGIRSYSNNVVELYGNVIKNNSSYGIYSSFSDIVRIGKVYGWWGYNTIRNNGSNEIHTDQYYPAIEISGASIHDTSPWEIYNYPGNPAINAQSVYWGSDGPQVSGNVNLMANIYWSLPAWDGQTRTAGSPIGKIAAPPVAGEIEWYWDPNTSDYEKVKIGKEIISSQPESPEATEALWHLYSIIRPDFRENILGEKEKFFDYLEDVYNKYSNSEVSKLAIQYMTAWKMLERDYVSAIQIADEALKLFKGEDRNWALVDLINANILLGHVSDAKNTLRELRTSYKDDNELFTYLESDIKDMESQIAEGLFKPAEYANSNTKLSAIPDFIGHSQNYPNPFNPTTSIQYQIPPSLNNSEKEIFISLKVYDILGKEVATLVNEMKKPGIYTVTFDASELTSGIYIYQLRTNNFVSAKKMLLLK